MWCFLSGMPHLTASLNFPFSSSWLVIFKTDIPSCISILHLSTTLTLAMEGEHNSEKWDKHAVCLVYKRAVPSTLWLTWLRFLMIFFSCIIQRWDMPSILYCTTLMEAWTKWHPLQVTNAISSHNRHSVFKKRSSQISSALDGFGGLVVCMLASGSRVHGFKPGRSRWIFFLCTKSSAFLPSEGKLNNLSHAPTLRHVKEPSNWSKLRIASKIPSIKVPSFASRGLLRRLVWWRLWRWMRELLRQG
jgi:hypothetical protein